MPTVDPENELVDAWLVALLPQKYSQDEQIGLFDRGYNAFRDEQGKTDSNKFINAVEKFTLHAFKNPSSEETQTDPIHTDPGILAMAATLGAVSVKNHPEYLELTDNYYAPDMKLLGYIKELWVDHVFWLLSNHDQRVGFLQEIAEIAYERKKEDKLGPAPGRVCTGIKRLPQFDNTLYVEISLEHYNRFCEVRNDAGEIITKFVDGKAYVPGFDLDTKIRQMAERAFDIHIANQERELPNEQVAWIVNNTTEIQKKITQDIDGKRFDKLFTEDNYPKKLGVIVGALRTYEYDEIDFGEWLTAEEIYEAIEDYYPHLTERAIVDNINSPLAVSKILSNQEDHHDVEIDREDRVNKFKILDSKQSFIDVEIDSPEDILELPCMENIDEYLMEQKPTRWILYSVARILMSLENEFTIDELVEFYSRYPWFSEEVTRYQLNYERKSRMADGRPPNPIGCQNDNTNFGTFCIGLENCSYSIYGSLPMKDEVMDRLGEYNR